jgi:hypothetical protein
MAAAARTREVQVDLVLEDAQGTLDELQRTVRMRAGAAASDLSVQARQASKRMTSAGLSAGDHAEALGDGRQSEDAGAALACALTCQVVGDTRGLIETAGDRRKRGKSCARPSTRPRVRAPRRRVVGPRRRSRGSSFRNSLRSAAPARARSRPLRAPKGRSQSPHASATAARIRAAPSVRIGSPCGMIT